MTQIKTRDRIISRDNGTAKTRFLPEELSDRFAELSLRDGKLSVDDAITLLDLRETILYERLGKPAPDYEALMNGLADLRMAHSSPLSEMFDLEADRFAAMIGDGISNEQTWAKLERLVALRQRMVETERRRILQEESVIPVDKARQIVGRMISAVDLCVRDEDVKRRIMLEFRRLIQQDGSMRVVD